jgi:hypothetical protein
MNLTEKFDRYKFFQTSARNFGNFCEISLKKKTFDRGGAITAR